MERLGWDGKQDSDAFIRRALYELALWRLLEKPRDVAALMKEAPHV